MRGDEDEMMSGQLYIYIYVGTTTWHSVTGALQEILAEPLHIRNKFKYILIIIIAWGFVTN